MNKHRLIASSYNDSGSGFLSSNLFPSRISCVVGEARTFPGDLDFLRARGVEIVLLDDPACVAAMEEFQTRYPEVWSEDIGGRQFGSTQGS